MELDAATLGVAGTTIVGAAGSVWGAIKWMCARVDKQFAEAELKSEKARAEIKQELRECDIKHEKCETDRLKILEEVIGLRQEVKAVAKSQGLENKQQATNTADIQALKDRTDGPR